MTGRLDRRGITEAGFALTMIVVCGAVYWASLDLPEAVLEPIGPAVFPRVVSALLAVLSAAVLVGALRRRSTTAAPATEPRPWLAAATVALTVLYLGVMEVEMLGFRDATIAYLAILGAMLVDFAVRRLAFVAAIAVVLGIGTHYVFTRLFFIDLP